jgi:hypothetical protein
MYITYSHPEMDEFVDCLEEQFQLTDEVNVLSSTVSFRKQQGVVVVAWNGMVDLGFLQQLNGDLDVVDYAICNVPQNEARETGDEQHPPLNMLRGPFRLPFYGEQ